MTYAFVLDASACSGCKACQVACKDKNRLPPGVLWRRVYEVAGGGWQQEGAAWTTTVFAYNLSLSCNHCEHPKCAGVCPVDAYIVRDDGIVILDASKCTGCGYCAWACPYEAPQYDAAAGTMTKCDLCCDNLDAGLAPACVAACPLRALDCVEVGDGRTLGAGYAALWETPGAEHPYPMANNSRTGPHLALRPHAAMRAALPGSIGNLEEVRPGGGSARREAPLVAFTLLMQSAVGSLWAMLLLVSDARLQRLPLLLVGALLGAGLAISFAHLGARRNAWRVLGNLKKSWLSREILYSLFFGAGWLATLAGAALGRNVPALGWLTGLIGLGLMRAMARVYRLRTVPAWNTWRTGARFFLSAALLGSFAMLPLLARLDVPALPLRPIGLLLIALLGAQAVLEAGRPLGAAAPRFRLACMLAAMTGCAVVFLIPGWFGMYTSLSVLLIVLAEQLAGRWSFYQARTGARGSLI